SVDRPSIPPVAWRADKRCVIAFRRLLSLLLPGSPACPRSGLDDGNASNVPVRSEITYATYFYRCATLVWLVPACPPEAARGPDGEVTAHIRDVRHPVAGNPGRRRGTPTPSSRGPGPRSRLSTSNS